MHSINGTQQNSLGTFNTGSLRQDVFNQTLYSYVQTAQCTGCHVSGSGSAAASYPFADSNLSTAFNAATSIMQTYNPANPSSNLFAQQITNDHCGDPNICQLSSSAILAAINSWINPASCIVAGVTYPTGQSIPLYSVGSVPFGQTCPSAGNYTCVNGNYSDSNLQGLFSSCTPAATPASCTVNGVVYQSGSQVPLYTSQNSPTCPTTNYTCTNGNLPGNLPTGTFLTCELQCPFAGSYVNSGTVVTAFSTQTVTPPTTCTSVSQQRTCTNGILSGSSSFQYSSCSNGNSCSLGSLTIANGGTSPAYKASAPATPGQSCAAIAETVTCKNGALSDPTAVQNCVENSCTVNGVVYASETSVPLYTSATVQAPATCQLVSPEPLCVNGNLSDSTLPTGTYAKCSQITSCTFGGNTYPSGFASIQGYSAATGTTTQPCSSLALSNISCTLGEIKPSNASATCTDSSNSSTFVPTMQASLLRLNMGLTPAASAAAPFQCQKPGTNCATIWFNSAQYNLPMVSDSNNSSGADQFSLLAFAGCNDIAPSSFGVNAADTVANQTSNLIQAGVLLVNNHVGGLASTTAFQSQVQAVFQTLINDPSNSHSTTQQLFAQVCTAANTFGLGMKGF
jgi:hypothetical protein